MKVASLMREVYMSVVAKTLAPVWPQAPRRLFGYDVISPLGQGAGTNIYAVCNPADHQVFALKHAVRRQDHDARFIDQLKNEYETASHIAHPLISKTFEFKAIRSILGTCTEAALLMELSDGEPLDQMDPVPVHRMIHYFQQVAEGLSAMHHAGFLHCDLKPGNIMVDIDGSVKIIDLGQSCRIGAVKPRIQGTPNFIAPEQVRCRPLSIRTDVFNFGATFYWALTGEHLPTMMNMHGDGFLLPETIATPAILNPLVPAPVSRLIMDCVVLEEHRRPSSMTEIAQRLGIMELAAINRFNKNNGQPMAM